MHQVVSTHKHKQQQMTTQLHELNAFNDKMDHNSMRIDAAKIRKVSLGTSMLIEFL